MSTTMLGVFKNYDVYTYFPADSEFLSKKSFRSAVGRLVDALNAYTENNSPKVVRNLIENIRLDIAKNRYVYFDIGGSTVGENETHIYAIKFTWDPFHSIEINEARTPPISSIGLYNGCVRWENSDFHAMFPVEFTDGITYKSWGNSACINKEGGCFYDLNEYLFGVFADSYYDYKESLLYLGYEHKEAFIGGPVSIAATFEKASKLLSKYPKGIDYNDSKECSKDDWFYNTLDLVYNELDKADKIDASLFYIAMRNYVKHIEDTRIKGDTKEE